MKTNLKHNIWIEGFDSIIDYDNFCWDKKSNIQIIYQGKTSEIPETLIKKCIEFLKVWSSDFECELFPRDYKEKNYFDTKRFPIYTEKNYYPFSNWLKESIQSACPEEDCIIYKIKL